MKLKRALYLGYYLKELDRKKFDRFLQFAMAQADRSKRDILTDLLTSVFRYNISILEYFQFRFYEKSTQQREQWAGTGYMYEYQLAMNPVSERHILDDKRLFYKQYSEYFVHKVATLEELQQPGVAERMLSNPSDKIVFKASAGKCGAEVEIRNCKEFDRGTLIAYMQEQDYGLVEEFIEQHPEMNRLSPSGVNTLRIITQLNESGDVDILGCRLRISVDSPVDNMAAGNLAAPVDEKTGNVTGPAVYSDITIPEKEIHPVTGVKIPGFKIPYFYEAREMVKEAAKKHPQNRSIGWDVVITERGPGLIEGNHDWCKLLWQLPAKEGLRSVIEEYQANGKAGKMDTIKKSDPGNDA